MLASEAMMRLTHIYREAYNEKPMQKVKRKLKEEPLVPLGETRFPVVLPALRRLTTKQQESV